MRLPQPLPAASSCDSRCLDRRIRGTAAAAGDGGTGDRDTGAWDIGKELGMMPSGVTDTELVTQLVGCLLCLSVRPQPAK